MHWPFTRRPRRSRRPLRRKRHSPRCISHDCRAEVHAEADTRSVAHTNARDDFRADAHAETRANISFHVDAYADAHPDDRDE